MAVLEGANRKYQNCERGKEGIARHRQSLEEPNNQKKRQEYFILPTNGRERKRARNERRKTHIISEDCGLPVLLIRVPNHNN